MKQPKLLLICGLLSAVSLGINSCPSTSDPVEQMVGSWLYMDPSTIAYTCIGMDSFVVNMSGSTTTFSYGQSFDLYLESGDCKFGFNLDGCLAYFEGFEASCPNMEYTDHGYDLYQQDGTILSISNIPPYSICESPLLLWEGKASYLIDYSDPAQQDISCDLLFDGTARQP